MQVLSVLSTHLLPAHGWASQTGIYFSKYFSNALRLSKCTSLKNKTSQGGETAISQTETTISSANSEKFNAPFKYDLKNNQLSNFDIAFLKAENKKENIYPIIYFFPFSCFLFFILETLLKFAECVKLKYHHK